MSWQLVARMPDRSIGAILVGWSARLTLRLNDVGSWQVSIPRESTPAGWPAPGAGVVFIRDGDIVASGMVDEEAYDWSAESADEDQAGPGIYTLTGDTDLARIGYRITYPTPGQPWVTDRQAQHWTYPLTGTSHAEDVMRVTVNWQAGSLALPARRVPGLRLGEATGAGSQVRISERFTPLLDALRKVALAGGGLVFDVLDSLDGGMEFVVRAPVDRTNTARFGVELGNVTSLQIRRSSPTVTDALVAAQIATLEDDSEARELTEIHDPNGNPAWGRREEFIDQRQVDDTDTAAEKAAEYQKAADEAFADGAEQIAVTATILDTPTVRWGRDYQLGDRATVLTPFGPVADLVRQVDITVEGTGLEDITSSIGTAASTSDPTAAAVRQLAARLSQLERAL